MLTLTPIVCIASAIAVSTMLETYMDDKKLAEKVAPTEEKVTAKKDKKDEVKTNGNSEPKSASLKWIVSLPVLVILVTFAWHCTYVTQTSYSSPSVVLASQNRDGSMHIIVFD